MIIRPPFDSWFPNLPEPYRFLAQKASQKQNHKRPVSGTYTLSSAFVWKKTPEKQDFWAKVHSAKGDDSLLPPIKKTALQWIRCGILSPEARKESEAQYKTFSDKLKSDLRKLKFPDPLTARASIRNGAAIMALNKGPEIAKNQVKKKKNAKKPQITDEKCRETVLIPSGESFFNLTRKRA